MKRYFVHYGVKWGMWICDGQKILVQEKDGRIHESGYTIGGLSSAIEISESEALGVGWRADLAKPTTPEDCALAEWHFAGETNCTFEAWLARSREECISQASSRLQGHAEKRSAAGATPAPDTIVNTSPCEWKPLQQKPRDFMSWLSGEAKRAALGELPPLQRKQIEAMNARRAMEQKRADELRKICELERNYRWSDFEEDDYFAMTRSKR